MSAQTPPGGEPGAQQQPPAGAGGGQLGDELSEEQLQEYVDQMRGAPVEQVVAEVLQALLNSAQVKLGRHDARLLIDVAGTVTEQTRPHLSEQVTTQIDDALSQLRMAQVQAEQDIQSAQQEGQEVNEPNDLAESPPEPTQERAEQQAQRQADQGSQTRPGDSGLWVPDQ